LRPELIFAERGGERVVHDTRSGSLVEHRLDELGVRVLEALGREQRVARLAERLQPLPAAEVERRVGELAERELLFEEDGVYMSLVVEDAEPAAGAAARSAWNQVAVVG
jgi:hypothetical protein